MISFNEQPQAEVAKVQKLEEFLKERQYKVSWGGGESVKRFKNILLMLTLNNGEHFIAKYIPTEHIIFECCGHVLATQFFHLKCPDLFIRGKNELWSNYIEPAYDMVPYDVNTLLDKMNPDYRSKYILFSIVSGVWDIHGKNLIADHDSQPYVIDFEHIKPRSVIMKDRKLYYYYWELEAANKAEGPFYENNESFIVQDGIIWHLVDYYSVQDIKKYIYPKDIQLIKEELTISALSNAWQPIFDAFPDHESLIHETMEWVFKRSGYLEN